MKKEVVAVIIIVVIGIICCSENISDPEEKKIYSNVFKGKVSLENQTEHSNALIYVEKLNRGVSSDSSGNYIFSFEPGDTIYSGESKVIYFLNDYDMDSAKIFLVRGKIKLDTLDADCIGLMRIKEMKQIIRVEGWTDKQEYRIGDTIAYTARFTNTTNRVVHLLIISVFNQLGPVGLYNDKYMPFNLSPCDPVMADREINLYKGYYEGRVKYIIRDRYYCANGESFLQDEYIVTAGLFIEGRLKNHFNSKFNKYVLEEWYKNHRGNSPKYDLFPNKYKFPRIKIIE
jgi:hypothetical protein